MHYLLYTDGAYYPEHGRSAIAYVIINSDKKTEVRRMHRTVIGETSGRAELKAIISALYVLPDDATSCTIISDSKYAINSCARRCIRYKNNDLLMLFDKIEKEKNVKVSYSWVRSHSGNFYNELCDTLCTQAIDEYVKENKK